MLRILGRPVSRKGVEWHGHILQAILASDADAAQKAMSDHLEIARDHILRIVEVQGNALPEEAPTHVP